MVTTNRTISVSKLTNKIGKVYSEKALSEICSASDSSLFWEWSTESSSRLFPFKPMEKLCFKCGEIKPLTEFYKHPQMADGRVNKCKECNKIDVHNNTKKNKEYYREYDQKRANLPHRAEARKIYQQTHPDVINRLRKKYIKNNPEKHAAHIAVGNAVRDGRLIKQPCEACGTFENIHAHHDDYAKPLSVRWLCAKHHSEHHKNLGVQR